MKNYFCRKINILPKIANFPKAVEKNLGFLYVYYIVKNRGFPPICKIERVEKMSAKHAFFSVFQKIIVVCCAIFSGFANAFSANLPSGYTELEYIESTGTQWIDTGYIPNITDTLTTVIKSPSTLPTSGVYYLYGTRDAYKVNGFVIQLYKI